MTTAAYAVAIGSSHSQPYKYANSCGQGPASGPVDLTTQCIQTPEIRLAITAPESQTVRTDVDATANADIEATEYDAFLDARGTSARSACTSTKHHGRVRGSCWVRAHAFVVQNWYLGCLLPASILATLLLIGWLTRDYARQLLLWIETQNAWLTFSVFLALFALVSFPVVVGYFVLLVTAGYLFGCLRGWFIVILGANLGVAIAHATFRVCRHRIPLHRLIKNETGSAILRVISGQKAFKVVFFTRLTPIPFGLQNLIFGVSSVNTRDYHLASLLGLLPAQGINVYLGSSLRSMHEVFNDNHTKVAGYISFLFEVLCGVLLMLWVVQKARRELSESLLIVDYDSDSKHTELPI